VQWLWFSVALFFSYGDSFGSFLENRKIRFVPHVIVYYLRYHTWVSFSMYAMLFVVSVLSLKRGTRCNRLYCPPLLLVRVLTAAMRLQCAQATTSIRWVRWQLIGEIPRASCSHVSIVCAGQYTWTIVTLGMIVFQMKYILTNIFTGAWLQLTPCETRGAGADCVGKHLGTARQASSGSCSPCRS
jgi:hypothetical protein